MLIQQRDTYLLDNKENPPPRIPKSIGDNFCKQDKRKQPHNFCLKEKNNNQRQVTAAETEHHVLAWETTQHLLSLLQNERKMISRNKVLIQSSPLLNVGNLFSFHHWLFRKMGNMPCETAFRRIIFHKVFYQPYIFFNLLYASLFIIIRVPWDRQTKAIAFQHITSCSQHLLAVLRC